MADPEAVTPVALSPRDQQMLRTPPGTAGLVLTPREIQMLRLLRSIQDEELTPERVRQAEQQPTPLTEGALSPALSRARSSAQPLSVLQEPLELSAEQLRGNPPPSSTDEGTPMGLSESEFAESHVTPTSENENESPREESEGSSMIESEDGSPDPSNLRI